MRRLVVGAVVVMGLGAISAAAMVGATHLPGVPARRVGNWYVYGTRYAFAPEPGPTCSPASRWCVTPTNLPSGSWTWKVTCGLPTGGHAESTCAGADVRLVGPIAPIDEVGVSLPAVPAGSRVLTVDAGGDAVTCAGAGWCIVGGEVVRDTATSNPAVINPGAPWIGYVPPDVYCQATCEGGWHLDLQGVALGEHWALRVELPKSGAPG